MEGERKREWGRLAYLGKSERARTCAFMCV